MGLVSEMVWEGGQASGPGSAACTKWPRSVLPHQPSVTRCDHPGQSPSGPWGSASDPPGSQDASASSQAHPGLLPGGPIRCPPAASQNHPWRYHRPALAIQPETHRQAEGDSFSHPECPLGPRGCRALPSILPTLLPRQGRGGGSGQASYVPRARHQESQLTVLPRVSWDRSFLVTQVWLL